MRRKMLIVAVVVFLCMTGLAHATMNTIGTAGYDSDGSGTVDSNEYYNLIYEGELGGSGLVWLDFTNTIRNWQNQVSWAATLGGSLTVTLNPGYTTSIDFTTGWRLPETDTSQADIVPPYTIDPNVGNGTGFGWGGPDASDYHDYLYGYNMVNSEMGHLFYESLGNIGLLAEDGTNQSEYGLSYTGDFNNLIASGRYWSTETSWNTDYAWKFALSLGFQDYDQKNHTWYGLAVRPGDVSVAPVPEPSTMLLLGAGLVGLIGARRKIK